MCCWLAYATYAIFFECTQYTHIRVCDMCVHIRQAQPYLLHVYEIRTNRNTAVNIERSFGYDFGKLGPSSESYL